MRLIAELAIGLGLFLPMAALAMDKVRVYSGGAVGCESPVTTLKAKPTMAQADIRSMDCLVVKEGTVLLVVVRPESSSNVVRVLLVDGSEATTFWISSALVRAAD